MGIPASTISGYLTCRHLPSAMQLDGFKRMLAEIGLSVDWVDVLERVRQSSDGRLVRPDAPYRGLEAFQPADAGRFFGRAAVTRTVLDRLGALRGGAEPGVLMVLGPSGSGKSSVLRAGVVPEIDAGALNLPDQAWTAELMTPGANPGNALENVLARTVSSHRVIVIDQFEEIFTAVQDPAQRSRFLDSLSALDSVDTLAVCGLRADYYEAATGEPALVDILQRSQIVIPPMTAAELRETIVEPARAVGASVDDGLVDVLLAELAPRGTSGYAHDPGSLPLLSFALLATWDLARQGSLTVADYRAGGGIHGAVQQTAEGLYQGLTPPQQGLARRVFLRLATVDDELPVARRRLRRAELSDLVDADEIGPVSAVEIVDRFAESRLLTLDHDIVEISHEALLTAWPRLRDWLDTDRAGLRLHRQLTLAANGWIESGRDESLLLRGSRLELATDWIADPDHHGDINRAEREYHTASQAAAETVRAAVRRRTQLARVLVACLVVLAIATTVLSAYALHARSVATGQRDAATTARDQALSREVAIESSRLRANDAGLASELAVAAYRISPTVDARSVLLDSSAELAVTRVLGPSGPTAVAASRDGRILAVSRADDGSVQLYAQTMSGPPTREGRTTGSGAAAQAFALAISPDDRLLAVGGADDRVTLWSIADPAHPQRVGPSFGVFTGAVESLAFSPDGRLLAAASSGPPLGLWNVGTPVTPRAVREPAGLPAAMVSQTVAFSPDGRQLVVGGSNGALYRWLNIVAATSAGARKNGASRAISTPAGTATLDAVAFSPDGRILAAGTRDGLLRTWTVTATGPLKLLHPPITVESSLVNALAFTADGTRLVTGGADNILRVWNTTGWAPNLTYPSPGYVTGVAVTDHDTRLAVTSADGALRFWPMTPPGIAKPDGNAFNVSYTKSGNEIAITTSGDNGGVGLWNVSNPAAPNRLGPDLHPDAAFGPVAGAGALTGDGRLLAVANRSAHVRLYDVSEPSRPRILASNLAGPRKLIESMAFSPNQQLLAVGSDDHNVYLWNVSDPAAPQPLSTITGAGDEVLGVSFSPNGLLLATASVDNKVRLVNISDPSHPRTVSTLTGFTNYALWSVFSPDGHTLYASSADHSVRIWDVTNPSRPVEIGGAITGPANYIYSIALSPSGHTLYAAVTDGTVWSWDVTDLAHPALLSTLRAAVGDIFTVAVSPDGRTLAVGGANPTVPLWDTDPVAVSAGICRTQGTPITQAEWQQYVPGAPYRDPCKQ